MEPNEFDMDAAAAEVAGGLFGNEKSEEPEAAPEVTPTPEAEVAAPAPEPPPSSWAKEHHETWGKLAPEARAYIAQREKQMLDGLTQYKEHHTFGKTMQEAIAPYLPLIQQQGLEPAKAIQALLNAHKALTTGSIEERTQRLHLLAQNLGIAPRQQPQETAAERELRERLGRLEGALTERQQAQLKEHQEKTTREVAAFAEEKDDKGNPKRPYFDDVADDIALFIQAGAKLDDETYLKAVYANPVTRAKEMARAQKEHEAELRKKAAAEVEASRKAKSSNVRNRDTGRAPTEPLGKMEDTMQATLADIKARPH